MSAAWLAFELKFCEVCGRQFSRPQSDVPDRHRREASDKLCRSCRRPFNQRHKPNLAEPVRAHEWPRRKVYLQ